MVEQHFKCPSCGYIALYAGNVEETRVVTCTICGAKGKITFLKPRDDVAIEVSHLRKVYGDLIAVDDVSFSIKKGDIYALLGPNGSGKTTTIKMLCGLLSPTSGTVTVIGRTLPCKSILQEIGYMPQDIAVYLDNTVHENLNLFGKIYGLSGDQLKEREREMLEFVNLVDRRDTLVTTLSGGMRHRVSLACALIHKPRLLFLDEPTVGVDPELRAAFWSYFKTVAKQGTTVIITTHYMDEADHCTRVGLLRQGKLIAEGAPQVLKTMTGTETLEDAFLTLARRER